MGLFDKKYCDICGEKIGLLGNRKLEDGNLCKNCAKKLSPWFNERRHSSVNDIKAQLAYREENLKKVSQFRVTRCIGDSWKVFFDESHRWLTVSRTSSPSVDENPDIIDYADITGCRFDIKENRNEIYRKTNEGTNVSYNPPRYKYLYTFDLFINVNNPFFDEIELHLNGGTVAYEPEPTMQISFLGRPITDSGVNPENCIDYCKYRDMGQEICREIDRARGVGNGYAQNQTSSQPIQSFAGAAASGSQTWSCASCGTQNTGRFCENCGNKKPVASVIACPSCGWSPAMGQKPPKFCPECGKQLY